ncbi:MAG: hypothetical protein NXY57DRAFT_1000479 [Lentinula lateritia]|nr:MAG: hypothetical protein NXY57DRAFT_1000479 [Lentinula lateritia]
MGLSGRKIKQRIGPDPRNLTWADDASKFGANYLAKFGWDSSKGLGVEGQGRTSHIKVSQKLDMLGIGAAQSKDPNGIAWKQNKDFESLLRRLNENNAASSDSGAQVVDGNAVNIREEEGNNGDDDVEKDGKKENKEDRKKRKKEEKEAKKERKEERKRKRAERVDEEVEQPKPRKKAKADTKVKEEPKVEKAEEPKRIIPRHRAHRARAIAAKNISSKSAVHISEILGIASSSSSSSATPMTAATPSGTLTPLDQDVLGLVKLTTSTKSVSEYFKERLLVKTSGNSSPLSSTVTPETNARAADDSENEDTPRVGLGSYRNLTRDDLDDTPRGGLGSTRASTKFTSAASTFQSGMSKFASMFTSASVIAKEETIVQVDVKSVDNIIRDTDTREERSRKESQKKEKESRNGVAEVVGEPGAVDVDDKARKMAKDERRREKAEKEKKKRHKRELMETIENSTM